MLQGMAGAAGGSLGTEPGGWHHPALLLALRYRGKTPGQRRRPSTSSAICPTRQRRSSASMFVW